MDITVTADDGHTLATVERLYAAYLGDNPNGMADLLAERAEVRFLGHVELAEREEARALFVGNERLLADLSFTIKRLVVDGDRAAATWVEEATTCNGEHWSNHGVDVFQVCNGEVVSLHENNDVMTFRRHFGDST